MSKNRTCLTALLGACLASEYGAETLEWGLLCALLIAGAVAVIVLIGAKMAQLWNNSNDAIPTIWDPVVQLHVNGD